MVPLLSGLFFYDIFWVFFTPVMVTVAKSFDAPIKLLFLKSVTSDGKPTFSMLGLGDIVLPGLLVAFAARCDACALQRRYFPLMVCGYAVGLAMANVAVAYFAQGQPALLYLVPCTLGPFLHAAQRDGTLQTLWQGPPSLLDPTPVRATRVVETPYQASTTDDQKPLMMSI